MANQATVSKIFKNLELHLTLLLKNLKIDVETPTYISDILSIFYTFE
jgi:hypothetical protein